MRLKATLTLEWLSYTLGVKVVADVAEAIDHMRVHNASHSDAIMTNSLESSERFINSVGSAAVYVVASTPFHGWRTVWFRR